MNLDVVILAAGQGTRMRSQKAKVLHELASRPLIHHVLAASEALAPRSTTVVVGHQADAVRESVGTLGNCVLQAEQLGTGHAVQTAIADLPDDGIVLVLYGDVPLIKPQTLESCVAGAMQGGVGLVTAHFEDPAALGRILRDADDAIVGIVEFKDANDAERAINEINSGILAAPAGQLRGWLHRVNNDNAQGEYYLTDIISLAVGDGVPVYGVVSDKEEVSGVNDRKQLAELERTYQKLEAERLMLEGVTLADPDRLDVRGRVVAGEDCFVDINVVLSGDVVLGNGVRIGAGAVITDSSLGDGVEVHPHTVVEGAELAAGCTVGPFARIRPGSRLGEGVKVGNFVETKKATLGAGTKASHLAYLGDATIGAETNIGAGTVTCNYDGVDKHETHIGDDVFVGTNSTLVAPIEIADGAFVAAGSTVTTRVEDGDLAVGRAKQRNISGWTRPDKRKDK